MDANDFFDKNITEENCNWSEFEQCNNHKWTITEMIKDFSKEHTKELIQEIKSLEILFTSNHALEENGYNKAISDCISLLEKRLV